MFKKVNIIFKKIMIIIFTKRNAFKIIIFCTLVSLIMAYRVYVTDDSEIYRKHKDIVDRYYQNRKNLTTSELGAVMYKNENYPEISPEKRNRTFVIWKSNYKGHGAELNNCKVTNCIITGNESSLQTADAVIVRLQLGIIPEIKDRDPKQRWLFLNDEAPHNAFGLAKRKIPLSELDNVFNWSLTYRSDADVPIPYGRTVALKSPILSVSNPPISSLVPGWDNKRQDVLVAILISNCHVFFRKKLIDKLQKFTSVDVYGKCGMELRNSCPGHFRNDCDLMSNYLFYLALENSKCYQYMTEKIFFNAYSKGAIPIIQGPSVAECEMFLPPKSYLHVDNYSNIQELANDIKRIARNETELLSYHKWRNHFEVLNEHGFFGVKPRRLCRVCEALNFNDDKVSVYSTEKLKQFLNSQVLCRVKKIHVTSLNWNEINNIRTKYVTMFLYLSIST